MRVLRVASLPLAFASLLFFSHITRAQTPVTWSMTANAPASLKAEDKFTAQVTAQIQAGWHLYSLTQGPGGPIPTRISLPEGQPFKLAGNATGPRPRVEMDPNFQITTETHEGNVSFRVPITVNAGVPSRSQDLNINVRFQACNDKLCLPPRTVKLSAPVMLVEAATAVTASPSPSPIPQKAKASPGPTTAARGVTGGWLNSVKVVMGLLEIAAAMKFLSNVDLVWHWGIFTREVVLASWVAIALLITLYLLGKFHFSHDSPVKHIGAVRLMIALVSLALGFYLLLGLFGRRLGELESFLPPAVEGSLSITAVGKNTGAFASNDELTWVTNDYESALTQAKTEKKPVFIDFTGYTCTNCRWMEVNMFTKTPVKEELAKYVRVRLYTDGEGQPYEGFQQMQQEKFGTVALPLYAVVNSDGNTLTTLPGLTRDQAEFVAFLKTGQANNEVSGQGPNFLTR